MRIETIGHECRDRPRRVVFARVSGALQVVQDLFVNIAEVLALGKVIEIDGIDLVDHLAHELAGLHVVVGVFEHFAHDATPALFAGRGQGLQCREHLAVNECE